METTKKLLVSVDLIKETAITPLIRNMVSTTDYNKKINLYFLAKRLIGSRFDPLLFPGLIVKTKFGTTCIIFSTGKIVVVGAKSEKDIEKNYKKFTIILTLF